MEELIKKLKEAGKLETIETEEDLRTAAKELGYSEEDVDKLKSESGVKLDDDALDQVAGGQNDNEWWIGLSDGNWSARNRVGF